MQCSCFYKEKVTMDDSGDRWMSNPADAGPPSPPGADNEFKKDGAVGTKTQARLRTISEASDRIRSGRGLRFAQHPGHPLPAQRPHRVDVGGELDRSHRGVGIIRIAHPNVFELLREVVVAAADRGDPRLVVENELAHARARDALRERGSERARKSVW